MAHHASRPPKRSRDVRLAGDSRDVRTQRWVAQAQVLSAIVVQACEGRKCIMSVKLYTTARSDVRAAPGGRSAGEAVPAGPIMHGSWRGHCGLRARRLCSADAALRCRLQPGDFAWQLDAGLLARLHTSFQPLQDFFQTSIPQPRCGRSASSFEPLTHKSLRLKHASLSPACRSASATTACWRWATRTASCRASTPTSRCRTRCMRRWRTTRCVRSGPLTTTPSLTCAGCRCVSLSLCAKHGRLDVHHNVSSVAAGLLSVDLWVPPHWASPSMIPGTEHV